MPTWLDEIITAAELPPTWQQSAREAALTDKLRAKAFGIKPENVDVVLATKANLLKSIYPTYSNFCQTALKTQQRQKLEVLWDLWLPLAMQLATQRQQLNRPFIQGILGGQGTGKTTLAKILTLILQELGYQTLSLSLDDLYKTYDERLALQQQDPRLIWRGPPGTHDVELGLSVLNQIRNSQSPVAVPRFDKSAHHGAGDRTTPEIVANVDIVLFEGWFVGAQPIHPTAFENPPPPILTAAQTAFARDMNDRLKDYLPLWEQLDSLIVLYPTDYRCSLEWRKQAEHQMKAAGKNGMSDEEIERFVEYFWQALHPELFITPLVKSPQQLDLVIEINPDHSQGAVYRPI